MVELDRALYRSWEGRLRHPDLLVAMDDPESGAADLADALLEGLAADLDLTRAVAELIDLGWYEMAEAALDERDGVDERTEQGLRRRLVESREADSEWIRRTCALLADLAGQLGVPLGLDRERLLEEVQGRREPVMAALDDRQAELQEALAGRADALRARVEERSDAAEWWRAPILAAVAAGDLRAAEQLIGSSENSDIEAQGPAAVPRPRRWTWGTTAPDIVLRWFGPDAKDVPREFRRHWPYDAAGSRLAVAFLGLASLDRDSASEMQRALCEFLDIGATRLRVLGDGGYYTALELPREVAPEVKVHLWIAPPDAGEPPEELEQLPYLVGIGTGLGRPESPFRRRLAVLDGRDIARLAAVPSRRRVGLLRILGPQWPIEALTGARADFVSALGPPDRWLLHLAWLIDLSGVVTPDGLGAIVHEVGLRPRLIAELLHGWAALEAPGVRKTRGEVYRWVDDAMLCRRMHLAIEDMAPSPAARVVLSCCVARELLGISLSGEDLAVELGSDVQVGEVLDGARELARVGLARFDPEQTDLFLVEDDGVFRALRSHAERALPEACDALATARDVAEQQRLELSDAARKIHYGHRFAQLEADRVEALKAGDKERAARLARAIVEEEARIFSDEATGEVTDLVRLIDAMIVRSRNVVERTIAVERQSEDRPLVAVTPWKVDAAIGALVQNAIDAIVGDRAEGEVEVGVVVRGDDVHVDVRDTGPGVLRSNGEPFTADDDWELWRREYTTKGAQHGTGLWLAQRILKQEGGAVHLIEARGVFPFDGGHLRAVFPLAE